MRPRSAKWWVTTALGTNLVLAAVILATYGSGIHGTLIALAATARTAFLWFIAAYAGGSLVKLFGPTFLPMKRLGRELGLAFAAALFVHLALVSWLCWIGAAPPVSVFVFFGLVAVLTFVLALLSVGSLHTILGPMQWWLLRLIAMNVILYAFLKDFMQTPLQGGVWHLIQYLPFAALAIIAPLLRIAAWVLRFRDTILKSHSTG